MLTPGAFREPMNYLDTTETQQNVSDYENFLRGVSFKNPGLKVVHAVLVIIDFVNYIVQKEV